MRLLIAKLAATSVRSVSFALNNDEDIAELATDLDSCVRLLRASDYDLVVLMVSEDQMRARDAIAHIRAEVGRVPMVVLTEPGGDHDTIPGALAQTAVSPETMRARERPTAMVPPLFLEPDEGRQLAPPFHREADNPHPDYGGHDQDTHESGHQNGQDRAVPWRWVTHGPSEAGARRRWPPAGIKQGVLPIGSLKGALTFSGTWDGLRVDGVPVPLSQAEFRIFNAIWRARGGIVTSEELLDAIYGEEDRPASRVLPVFLFKLRRKLAAVGVGEAIETEVGRGVRLRADAVPDEEPSGENGLRDDGQRENGPHENGPHEDEPYGTGQDDHDPTSL